MAEKNQPEEKADDKGKDLAHKLIFFAAGFVVGLLLYCVIFGCGCEEQGCIYGDGNSGSGVDWTSSDGSTIVITNGPSGTVVKNGSGNELNCTVECKPKTKDGGDNSSINKDDSKQPGGKQPGGEPRGGEPGEQLPDFAMTDIGFSCDYDSGTQTYLSDKITSLKIWPMNKGPGETGINTGGYYSISLDGYVFGSDRLTDLYGVCPELFKVTGMPCELDLMDIRSSNTYWPNVKHGTTVEVCLDYMDDVLEGDESNNCLTQLINCPYEGGGEPEGCQSVLKAEGLCGGECEVDSQPGTCEITGPDECSCVVPEGEPEPEPEGCQEVYDTYGLCQGECEVDGVPGDCEVMGQNECICVVPESGPEPGPELTECQQSQIDNGYCQDNCEIDSQPGYCVPDGDDCVCEPAEPEPEPEGCQETYDQSGVCDGECEVDGKEGICEATGPGECSCYVDEGSTEVGTIDCLPEDGECASDGQCCSGLNCCFGYCTTRSCED